MGILLYGVTPCSLCGQVIDEGDDSRSFPPIFFNRRSPAFVLNDGSVHDACLDRASFGPKALSKLLKVEDRRRRLRLCAVCGTQIDDPDDYFSTGPLSDSPSEPIAAVDWIETHGSCLKGWSRLPEMIAILEEVNRSPDWEGDVLEGLLERIQVATDPQDRSASNSESFTRTAGRRETQ